MFLHTIVPPEQIFAVPQDSSSLYKKVNTSFVEGTVQDGRFTVRRLVSTDPSLYLDPRFSPGGPFDGAP